MVAGNRLSRIWMCRAIGGRLGRRAVGRPERAAVEVFEREIFTMLDLLGAVPVGRVEAPEGASDVQPRPEARGGRRAPLASSLRDGAPSVEAQGSAYGRSLSPVARRQRDPILGTTPKQGLRERERGALRVARWSRPAR
jgi:hypothetical protein